MVVVEQVRVDAERDVGIGVPHELAKHERLDARRDAQAGVGMPQAMESEVRQQIGVEFRTTGGRGAVVKALPDITVSPIAGWT